MTHFHLMRTQQNVGSFPFQKSPKLILTHFNKVPSTKKSQVQKSPNPVRGEGGHLHFGPIPKFPRFLYWKASLSSICLKFLTGASTHNAEFYNTIAE